MNETLAIKESLDAMTVLPNLVIPTIIEAQKHLVKLIESLNKFILLNCIILGCNIILAAFQLFMIIYK